MKNNYGRQDPNSRSRHVRFSLRQAVSYGFRENKLSDSSDRPRRLPAARQANSLPASRRIRAGRQHARCSPSAQPVPGTGTLLTTGETALPRRRAAGRPIRETFPGQPAHSPPTPRGRKRGATVCSSCGSSVPPSCSPRYARCRRADCRRSRCRSVPRVL